MFGLACTNIKTRAKILIAVLMLGLSNNPNGTSFRHHYMQGSENENIEEKYTVSDM